MIVIETILIESIDEDTNNLQKSYVNIKNYKQFIDLQQCIVIRKTFIKLGKKI